MHSIDCRLAVLQLLPQRAALEVVPELAQPCDAAAPAAPTASRASAARPSASRRLASIALAAIKLPAVVLGEEGAPLALLLLRGQLGDELGQQRAARGSRVRAADRTPASDRRYRAAPGAPRGACSISCTRAVAPSCCLMRSLRRCTSSCTPLWAFFSSARLRNRCSTRSSIDLGVRRCASPRRRNPSCRINFMSGAMMRTATGPDACSHRYLRPCPQREPVAPFRAVFQPFI